MASWEDCRTGESQDSRALLALFSPDVGRDTDRGQLGVLVNRILAIVLASSAPIGVASPVAARLQDAPSAAASADPSRSRADALVAQMTLDEKIALVHGWFPPMTKEAGPDDDLVIAAGHIPGNARLGIPVVRESDASLGVANQVEQRKGDVATALPSSLATAASFDPDVARAGGEMIGSEARAKRFNVLLAGGVNLTRDPWNGRNFEYLGEDPLLAGRMAGAHIAGVQSNGIVSTVKHLSLNAQETGRMVYDARIEEAAHRESDLLAFQIAIEEGKPGSVMCAYNKVNGDWACENDHLLNDVLKGDWGYRGFVMSDWGAVHSTEKAALAGLDQQSGQELDRARYFAEPLKAAVEAGRVPTARLDDMVARYLTALIDAGQLDTAMPPRVQPIDYDAHAAVAQRAIEAGIVLLKNEGGLLPLAKTAQKIAVIGGRADVGVLSGGGSSQVRSVGGAPVEIPLASGPAASFVRITWHASSPLDAIRKAAPQARVSFDRGWDAGEAAAAAAEADIAIVFATQWTTEAEDVLTLDLPYRQNAMIDAVLKANPRTIVVLETGGPVLMPWLDRTPAVVEAWYPGQRGGEAIARVLFGDVNPSGHLPITFPAAAEQAPRPRPVGLELFRSAEAAAAANPANAAAHALQSFPVEYQEGSDVGYRWYERRDQAPLFPFGHGLSYTEFAYSNLQASGGRSLSVSFDMTNNGARAGADVAQLYVARDGDDMPMRLAGFERVELAPGETKRVTLTAEPRILAEYDTELPGWRIERGTYRVAVGEHARDRSLTGTARIDEQTIEP